MMRWVVINIIVLYFLPLWSIIKSKILSFFFAAYFFATIELNFELYLNLKIIEE